MSRGAPPLSSPPARARDFETASWWQPNFSRRDAERELIHAEENAFVVRPSSMGGVTVSALRRGEIVHVLVDTENGYALHSEPSRVFPSLTDLLHSMGLLHDGGDTNRFDGGGGNFAQPPRSGVDRALPPPPPGRSRFRGDRSVFCFATGWSHCCASIFLRCAFIAKKNLPGR